MSDLVRGKYAVTAPLVKFSGGGAVNATQGNVSSRSNLEWTGVNVLTDTAGTATGVMSSVAIPVEYGDVITKVSIVVGATTATTPTHSWGALYSGIATPALLAQSVDGTTVQAFTASTVAVFTLASPVVVTPVNAPNGFLYAAYMVTSGGSPSAVTAGGTVATAAQYQWFTNSPLFLSATSGTALTTTAPATIASPSAKATIPVIFLS